MDSLSGYSNVCNGEFSWSAFCTSVSIGENTFLLVLIKQYWNKEWMHCMYVNLCRLFHQCTSLCVILFDVSPQANKILQAIHLDILRPRDSNLPNTTLAHNFPRTETIRQTNYEELMSILCACGISYTLWVHQCILPLAYSWHCNCVWEHEYEIYCISCSFVIIFVSLLRLHKIAYK